MAFLNWLSTQSDSSRETLMTLTGIGVAKELFHRLTGQDRVNYFKVKPLEDQYMCEPWKKLCGSTFYYTVPLTAFVRGVSVTWL